MICEPSLSFYSRRNHDIIQTIPGLCPCRGRGFVNRGRRGSKNRPPPAKAAPKKIENTDPALRLKWADQYEAMKAQTPLKT